jgi:hypothetical protein
VRPIRAIEHASLIFKTTGRVMCTTIIDLQTAAGRSRTNAVDGDQTRIQTLRAGFIELFFSADFVPTRSASQMNSLG